MRNMMLGRRLAVSRGIESFNHDNTILARRRRSRRGVPLVHFTAFVYLVLVLRIFAMAEMGPGNYSARMIQMQDGPLIDRIAAFVMAPDPISRDVALNLRRGFQFISGATQ